MTLICYCSNYFVDCLLLCDALNLSAKFLIYCTSIFTSVAWSWKKWISPIFLHIRIVFLFYTCFCFAGKISIRNCSNGTFFTFPFHVDFEIKEKTHQPLVCEDLKTEKMYNRKKTHICMYGSVYFHWNGEERISFTKLRCQSIIHKCVWREHSRAHILPHLDVNTQRTKFPSCHGWMNFYV